MFDQMTYNLVGCSLCDCDAFTLHIGVLCQYIE